MHCMMRGREGGMVGVKYQVTVVSDTTNHPISYRLKHIIKQVQFLLHQKN